MKTSKTTGILGLTLLISCSALLFSNHLSASTVIKEKTIKKQGHNKKGHRHFVEKKKIINKGHHGRYIEKKTIVKKGHHGRTIKKKTIVKKGHHGRYIEKKTIVKKGYRHRVTKNVRCYGNGWHKKCRVEKNNKYPPQRHVHRWW